MPNDPMFKYVNVIDERTGMPLLDAKTHKPISRRVQMTDEEVAAFEAEREAQQSMRPTKK